MDDQSLQSAISDLLSNATGGGPSTTLAYPPFMTFSSSSSSNGAASLNFLEGQQGVPNDIAQLMHEALESQAAGAAQNDQLYNSLINDEQDGLEEEEEREEEMEGLEIGQASYATDQQKAFPDEQDDENDMMDLDIELGGVDEPKLFREVLNYSKNPALSNPRKRANRSRGKKVKVTKAYPALPFRLNELMRTANMKYIDGRNEDAKDLLREVIKERADSHEAWLSLGMIYQSENNAVKTLQCKLMAAHLSSTNNDLWKSLAEFSKEQEHFDQAIYCYKKAIANDPNDMECVFQMSELNLLVGNVDDAQLGFEHLLSVDPLHRGSIKSLARIYLKNSLVHQAIALFEVLKVADIQDPLPATQDIPQNNDDDEYDEYRETEEILHDPIRGLIPQRMEYEEINMLAELYIEVAKYQEAINIIHQGISRLHGVSSASVSYHSSEEYERNFPFLPLELRAKIGICCVYLDDMDGAENHLPALFEGGVENYPELFFEVGEAYMANSQTLYALDVFKSLLKSIHSSTTVRQKLAECHLLLGNDADALEAFQQILKKIPGDIDTQNQIILLLEKMGDTGAAAATQKKFLLSRESDRGNHLLSSAESSMQITPNPSPKQGKKAAALIIGKSKPSAATKKKLDQKLVEIRKAAQKMAAAEAGQLKTRIQTLEGRLDKKASRTEFLTIGKKLFALFSGEEKLFRRKELQVESDHVIGLLKAGITEDFPKEFETPPVEPDNPQLKDHFALNIPLNEWLEFLIDYAILAAEEGKHEDSMATLRQISNCIKFREDPRIRIEIILIFLAVAVHGRDYDSANQIVRNMCHYGPYLVTGLRLYSFLLTGGANAIQAFSNSPNQKFLHRLVDKVKEDSAPDIRAVHAFCTYGHILFCAKSYAKAIPYYLKARALCPKDHVINLCLGINFLHRSTNKSESRFGHIIRGFTFLMSYYQLKEGNREAEYNLGRAFHFLSLYHLAIPFYDRLMNTPGDFSREAAYNIHMIYVIVGSTHLAQQALEKCWTI